MKDTTIIRSLYDWFQNCELLNTDAPINVDMLEEDAGNYCLEVVPCNPVIAKYADGSSKNQYLFIFASREYYSSDEVNNMKNLEFYEDLQEWIAEQNINEKLPVLPNGFTAQSIEMQTSGYVMDNNTKTARYQIQCRLKYIKEAKTNENQAETD